MNYVAIARKWRPTTFAEIAGQGHVTRTLENAITLNRVHHAYLFSGPRGVGKTTAARTLARSINCQQGPTVSPCGICVSCTEIAQGNSPDVIEIDGASNNSVDDIRDLRDAAQYLPVNGRKKIYIVDEVHMLSKGAFNALLKILEEPPKHIMFMFATTEPQRIPNTILSRLQRFEFKRIASNIVVERLQKICQAENISIDEGGLRLIARAGEGSMRDSQSLLDQVISFSGDNISIQNVAAALGLVDRGLLYQMLEGIVTAKADLCLEAISKVYSYGYDLSEFSAEMLELLRNATMVVLSPSSHKFLDIPTEEQEHIQQLARQSSADVFVRSFQVMLNTHEQVAHAPRPKLVLEMAVARLISIRPAKPIDSLIERLSQLESRSHKTPKQPQKDADDDDPAPAARSSIDRTFGSSSQPKPKSPPQSPPQQKRTHLKPSKVDAPVKIAPPSESTSPTETKPATSLASTSTSEDYWKTFARFHAELKDLRPIFEIWANDSHLLKVVPPTAYFVFPSPFIARNASKTKNEPELLTVLQSIWPACTQIHTKLRDTKEHETFRERRFRLREEKRDNLRQEFLDNPTINNICTVLKATLHKVRFEDEEISL